MSATRNEQRIPTLRDKIQEKLDARSNDLGFSLHVVDVVRDNDDWLHFIVKPDSAGARAYDYARALSDIEVELRQEDEQEVLLVPNMPD